MEFTERFVHIYLNNPRDRELLNIIDKMGVENIFSSNGIYRFVRNGFETHFTIGALLFAPLIRRRLLGSDAEYFDKRFLCILLCEYKMKISDPFQYRHFTSDANFMFLEKEIKKYVHLYSETDGWDSIDIDYDIIRTVINRKICPFTDYPNSKYPDIFIRTILINVNSKMAALQWLNKEILTDLLYYISKWSIMGGKYIYNNNIQCDKKRVIEFLNIKYIFPTIREPKTVMEFLSSVFIQKIWDILLILIKLGGNWDMSGNVSKFGIKRNFRKLFYLGVFRDYYPLCVKRELYILSRAIDKFKNWKNVKCYNNIILSIPFHPKYGNERIEAEENYYSLLQSLNNNS